MTTKDKNQNILTVGDRVICPAAYDTPGTLIQICRNDFTMIKHDDGVVACAKSYNLVKI